MLTKYLKKLCLVLLFTFFTCSASLATQIKFDNEIYNLKFSKKAPFIKGYINEYIRPSENTKNWTKLIGVYHHPESSDPIKFAIEMRDLVKGITRNAEVSLYVNKDKNEAMVDFVVSIPSKNHSLPYLEFNVFKYKKYDDKGVIAFQYAQRYYDKGQSYDELKSEFNSNRKKIILLVADVPIPKLVEKDIVKK